MPGRSMLVAWRYGFGTLCLIACCSTTVPLQAASQYAMDAPGVSVDLNGAQLMHRNGVPYPPQALAGGIQGEIVARLRLDARGNVVDAVIVSGPDELRKAVLESVLGWHFAQEGGPAAREVKINFAAQKAAATIPVLAQTADKDPAVLRTITISGFSDAQRADLLNVLSTAGLREGAQLSTYQELQDSARKSAQSFDEHMIVSQRRTGGNDVTLYLSAPSSGARAETNPIRVGPSASQMNLISKVQPDYPPLAKAARVQGTVQFEARIGKDGHVQDLRLISGHPLLIQAAMQAARQWVYRTTLLNGNPVEVITNIDITFALD